MMGVGASITSRGTNAPTGGPGPGCMMRRVPRQRAGSVEPGDELRWKE